MEEGQGLKTSGIFDAYLAGEAGAFFDGHFGDDRAWDRARRVARPIDPPLASVLEKQNGRYEKSPAREAHLRALRSGAAAVVTGQQTGLFLGPLYTLYKAASTVRLARWLADRWGAPVVPVFWLQTEDHDLEEIAVCHVARGTDEPLTMTLDVRGDGTSVAQCELPAAIEELLSRLSSELSRLPHGDEHVALLSHHYTPGASWSGAFAGVLASLFAEEGLVLIDPRVPELAPLAAPVHRRALIDAGPMARALTLRVAALEAAGFAAGVHVRGDAPLSFFHPFGSQGPRCRLAPAGGAFVELGGTRIHTQNELLTRLGDDPAAFSTSALLRPILQDTWFPTAAYVGGPGEIAYFAQMAPLYVAFALPMPLIVPRSRFRVIDAATRRALLRRGLTSASASRPFEEVLATARGKERGGTGGEKITLSVMAGIDRVLEEVAPLVREAGGRGERALRKTRGSMARSAAKMGRVVDRAVALEDREIVEDVRRIQAVLQPRGVPQERFFGLPSFAARYGQRAFVERVLSAATPLHAGIQDLEP